MADVLEDLTHNMCCLFGRATKAVSVCRPAYYADLVCERARRYLSGVFEMTPPELSVAGDALIRTETGATTTISNAGGTSIVIITAATLSIKDTGVTSATGNAGAGAGVQETTGEEGEERGGRKAGGMGKRNSGSWKVKGIYS